MKSLFFFLCFSLILMSCSKQKHMNGTSEPLLGTWERIDDNLAGMQVQVEKSGTLMIGKLITVPNSAIQSGFAKGDIKWKDL